MPQREDQNTTLGGLDPEIPKNEPVTPANARTPDSMTPPTKEEAERQKSYAQMRREHKTTEDEEKAEEARKKAEPKLVNRPLSVAMQPQPVPVHRGPPGIRPSMQGEVEQREGETPTVRHLEDMTLLPKFSVDDARKLKGGEGQQFRVDAIKMVEAERKRVDQLHEIVGTEDIWLGCDGQQTDPPNDFTSLDAAMAAAEAQIEAGKDDGDSDVKEIALVSEALMETARYWAVEGPEQAPPPEGGALERRADESDDSWYRRQNEWREREVQRSAHQHQAGLDAPQWQVGPGPVGEDGSRR
jgi:hypothetical protein